MKIFAPFSLMLVVLVLVFVFLFSGFKSMSYTYYAQPDAHFWGFQSIDTMKYSRDLSREKMNDSEFDKTINAQIKNIASTGATHVAIATPYDQEFIPMLNRWVAAARKYNLKVWFRGNWSGWEKWFDYPAMTRAEHTGRIRDFIFSNADLFKDGDLFSSCPECENGGPGDPRNTGDAGAYREFIIREYQESKAAFRDIGKKVGSNYFSMNGDVARLIMDRATTEALDGIVTIDHYVKTPQQLIKDVEDIAANSGGKVVLGEFGVTIPDIHGIMSDWEKEQWMTEALNGLSKSNVLAGVNYWVNVGGSTALWDSEGNANSISTALERFYEPNVAYGTVRDGYGNPIRDVKIYYSDKFTVSDKDGYFELRFVPNIASSLKILAPGYIEKEITAIDSSKQMDAVLEKADKNMMFKAKSFFIEILSG